MVSRHSLHCASQAASNQRTVICSMHSILALNLSLFHIYGVLYLWFQVTEADTLTSIAAHFNMVVSELKVLNKLMGTNANVFPGQVSDKALILIFYKPSNGCKYRLSVVNWKTLFYNWF